jgi:hypothetical protein
VGEGFGFEAAVQRGQVGCLRGGDGEHDFQGAGVADYPALGGVDAVVAFDFSGEGAGESDGLQNRGALCFAAGDGDVPGTVGGDQQGQDPAQRGERDEQADERGRGPEPGSVLADVAAGPVGEQAAGGEGSAESAGRGGQAGGACQQDQQAEQGQGEALG